MYLLAGAGLCAAVLVWATPLLASVDSPAEWLAWLAQQPATPWILSGFIILGAVVIFPGSTFVYLSGAIYGANGFWIGLPVFVIGSAIGWGAGRLLTDRLRRLIPAGRIQRVADLAERHGMWASLLLRWVPGSPAAIVNVSLGVLGIPAQYYLPGTLLGAFFPVGSVVLAGAATRTVLERVQDAVVLGWVGVGAMVCLAVFFMIKALRAGPNVAAPADSR